MVLESIWKVDLSEHSRLGKARWNGLTFVGFRDEYTGQLYSGKGKASIIAPIEKELREITFGGFVQGLSLTEKPCIVGALTSDIGERNEWNENADYFAVTLNIRDNKPTLGMVHHRDGQKIEKAATSPVPCFEDADTTRFFFAVSLFEHDDGLEVRLYQATDTVEKIGEWNLSELKLPSKSYFVALISSNDSESQLRSSGGIFLSSKFLSKRDLVPVAKAGFLTLLDKW